MSARATNMCAMCNTLDRIQSRIYPTALNSNHFCKHVCSCHKHVSCVQDTEPHPEPHPPDSAQQQPEPAGLRSHRGWQDQHSHAGSAA